MNSGLSSKETSSCKWPICRLRNAAFYARILLMLHQFQSLSVNQSEPFKQYIYTPMSIGVFCFLKLTICTHHAWTNQFLGHENGKQLQVTTIKITEFKEINPSTDLICLAQQVHGGAATHTPPSDSYGYTNVTKQKDCILIEDLIGCELEYLNNGKNQG